MMAYEIGKNFVSAFREMPLWPSSNRAIAWTYLKIALKTIFFRKLYNSPYNADKLLGLNLSFFDGYLLS